MIRAPLVALSFAAVSQAAAQIDTARQARDTVTRDTVAALLPRFVSSIPSGPLPPGIRYTFTADSLLFTNARTLSDLLAHIPGVYVARGGWYGQPEIVLYGGKGPAGLEVYWDGVLYQPLGRDSVYLDPARVPLAPLERVDVIVLPATLQVYLVTQRPRSTAPVTQVGIVTGDQDIAGYRAGYATRGRSGLGIAVLADWNSLDGNPASTTTGFDSNDLWLKAEYVPPGGRVGASFQISASSWHRRPSADGRVDGWRQERRDRLLRVFLASRDDGLGVRFVGTLGDAAIDRDTLFPERRAVSAASLELTQRWRDLGVGVTARFGAAGMPTQLEARGGVQLLSRIAVAATARHARYAGGVSGQRAHLSAGVLLPLGFSVRTDLAWQRDLQAPLATAIPRRTAAEQVGWVRFDHPWLAVAVGRGRRDAFIPFDFAAGIKVVDRLGDSPLTEFVAAHGVVRAIPGVTLSGWYFDPLTGGADFEPPHHARLSATFYSKFWRVFRSGVFALRGEVAVESWSRWVGGVDPTGAPLPMGGATFVETNLEMQLVGVTLFWVVRNVNGMRAAYVEGLGHPKSVQLYGARWSFTN